MQPEPRWETIFTRKIIHASDCPFVEGDANADGHVECECYVSDLWDAIQDSHTTCNALRLAFANANVASTAYETRMPRGDWEAIVEAALAQRRAVDPTVVDE